MKRIIFTLLAVACTFSTFAQLNVTYKANVQYNEEVTDVWGYVAPNGDEYAIVGAINGVSIVNVTDAENSFEAFYINGVSSGWRDIKTWGEYAYVTNETSNGVMVIDLTDLPNSVSSFDWTPNISGLGTLSSCHNIYIDELGYAYLAGCNINGGGIIYVDVFTTPGTPVYAGKGPAIYSHDVYARDNKSYSSEIYSGAFAIYDVADKNNTVLLGTQTTLFEFAHNAWLSDDGNVLFTTDEVAGATVGSYDVSDPTNIQPLDNFQPYETLGDGVIPHNVHVWNDWLIVSYYSDGCIIIDGSRPENLVEVGNFDTFIPTSTGFSGAWGAYPFLPSGLILVSDRTSGLYVLEPNYVSACWLEGEITDASNGNALNGASVELITTNVFEESAPNGEYKTGYAVSGTYDVLVKKAGFEAATAQAELENGEITILDVELAPLTPFAISGIVLDEDTGEPVPNAKVSIENDGFSYQIDADANGIFDIAAFFAGDYDVFAGLWGYKTTGLDSETIDENSSSLTIEIAKGYEDIFSLDLGWTTEFNANSGMWERGIPIGVEAGGGIYITPPEDVTEDIGNHCYVTGNVSDLFGGVLIAGDATLISPVFNIADYNEPYLSYHFWYLSVNPNNGEITDTDFFVKIDNGTESVYIDTISFFDFYDLEWKFNEIYIPDHIEPSSTMTVSYEASTPTDFTEIVEAAVDYFQVWDANPPVGTKNIIDNSISINAYPNPSSQDFVIDYELDNYSDNSKLLIYNILGELVQSIDIADQVGSVRVGSKLEKGIYLTHITNGETISQSLKLVKQ